MAYEVLWLETKKIWRYYSNVQTLQQLPMLFVDFTGSFISLNLICTPTHPDCFSSHFFCYCRYFVCSFDLFHCLFSSRHIKLVNQCTCSAVPVNITRWNSSKKTQRTKTAWRKFESLRKTLLFIFHFDGLSVSPNSSSANCNAYI